MAFFPPAGVAGQEGVKPRTLPACQGAVCAGGAAEMFPGRSPSRQERDRPAPLRPNPALLPRAAPLAAASHWPPPGGAGQWAAAAAGSWKRAAATVKPPPPSPRGRGSSRAAALRACGSSAMAAPPLLRPARAPRPPPPSPGCALSRRRSLLGPVAPSAGNCKSRPLARMRGGRRFP